MSKSTKIVLWILLAIIIVAGVWYGVSKHNKPVTETGPIKIGYIGPLTGPSAVLGMDAIKAVEIAADEINARGGINGRNIEVIAEDDQYLTQKTVDSYNKLVNIDKAKILLVATYGGVFAIADRAKQDGVLVIDPLDCNSAVAMVDKNIFCLATETESIGYALADYAVAQRKMKAGIMYSTKDSFMSLVKDAFKDKYEAAGGKTQEENFLFTDNDFKTSLLKIRGMNPDVLVILGHDEQGIIMNQARELGINAQFLTSGTITSPGAQSAAKGYADGTVFAFWDADPNNALAAEFLQKFTAKVGRPPIFPLTTNPAYDTIKVLADKVLPKVNDIQNDAKRLEQMKTTILEIQDYQGATGQVTFGKDGAARIKESVWKLVGDKPTKL